MAKGQFTFLSPWWDEISQSAKDLISHLLCVDPESRYTIREFLAHPWIREAGPTPREERKNMATSDGSLRAFDVSRLADGERKSDFRSPGAVNLREVFDVGYAVHRQEEEGKRRKQIGAKAGVSRLVGLNEDSEEDKDTEMTDDAASQYVHKPTSAQNATQQLEQRMRNAQIDDQREHRGRERERQSKHHGTEKGYGQHSAAVTAAARQQVRERNREKGAFELNLDGATLLGRRGMKTSARVA